MNELVNNSTAAPHPSTDEAKEPATNELVNGTTTPPPPSTDEVIDGLEKTLLDEVEVTKTQRERLAFFLETHASVVSECQATKEEKEQIQKEEAAKKTRRIERLKKLIDIAKQNRVLNEEILKMLPVPEKK